MTRPDPAPGIFFMFDQSNTDPASEATWGDFGSWMWWEWDTLNGAANTYDFSDIEDYLAAADALGKKVAVSIMLYPELDQDATPLWVYGKDADGNQLYGWPVVGGSGTFPKWNDATWNYWYSRFVAAFGAEFNGDDRIHSIWICTALYGETVISGLGSNTHNHLLFFKNSVDWYSAAFPDTPIFMIHSAPDTRRQLALYCDEHDVNSKMNVLAADVSSHTINPSGWGTLESGAAEVAYYATLGNETTTYSYPGLGHWMAYEHGDIEANPEDMYQAMLVALCTCARCVDFSCERVVTNPNPPPDTIPGSALLDQLAGVDSSLLGSFWDFCLRVMGHPMSQVAMWVGRDTGYKPWAVGTTEATIDAAIAADSTLWKKVGAWGLWGIDENGDPKYIANSWDAGWDGPWTRGDITVNATGYSIVSATYASAPAALTAAGVEYGDAGIGYCADANLTVDVAGMPPGTYSTTVIYSVTGAGAAWAVDTDTMTVAQDGTGSLTSVGGPCWVHLVVIEPGTVGDSNVAPNAPTSPMVEQGGVPMTNPTQVETLTPEFSWTFSDPNSGDSQTAYQIMVADTLLTPGNSGPNFIWDSGKVASTAHANIVYNNDSAGSALAWDTNYFWTVRTWDDADAEGAWCAIQTFRTREAIVPVATAAIREHFRVIKGRNLDWLGPYLNDSGLRAMQRADITKKGICLIQSITVELDSADLVTRVYPQAPDDITLALATDTEPLGFTMVEASNYLQHDAGYAAYGLLEAWKMFDDVTMEQNDSLLVHREYAANTLLSRAAEYLRTRAELATHYKLTVLTNERVNVGETIRVVYHGYNAEGTRYLTVDDDLYIVSVTVRLNQDGLRQLELEASTVDRQLLTGEQVIARAIKATNYL